MAWWKRYYEYPPGMAGRPHPLFPPPKPFNLEEEKAFILAERGEWENDTSAKAITIETECAVCHSAMEIGIDHWKIGQDVVCADDFCIHRYLTDHIKQEAG